MAKLKDGNYVVNFDGTRNIKIKIKHIKPPIPTNEDGTIAYAVYLPPISVCYILDDHGNETGYSMPTDEYFENKWIDGVSKLYKEKLVLEEVEFDSIL